MPIRRCIAGCLLLYVVACCLPAFVRYGAEDGRGVYGIACLVAIPFVLFHPAWYANLLFFWGCMTLAGGNARRASRVGLAATLLALSFIVPVLLAPAGGRAELRAGAWTWMASILGLTATAWVARAEGVRPDPGEGRAHGSASISASAAVGSSSASSSSVPLSSRSPS